jgi:hypothetical protein
MFEFCSGILYATIGAVAGLKHEKILKDGLLFWCAFWPFYLTREAGDEPTWTHEPPTEPGWYWGRPTFTLLADPPRFDDNTPDEPSASCLKLDDYGVLRLWRRGDGLCSEVKPIKYYEWWPIPIEIPPTPEKAVDKEVL